MTIAIEQPQIEEGKEKKIPTGPKDLVSDGAFAAPETNAFGQTFRYPSSVKVVHMQAACSRMKELVMEKEKNNGRNYEAKSERKDAVEEFYQMNHIHQTYEFVKKMREEYTKLNKAKMSIWECCELLIEFVDESDPDLDEPQIQHLLQSAEAIRKDYPDEDWLHLTALYMYLKDNPDSNNPQYNMKFGVYSEGCGFDNLMMSWGHDDYMYMVAKENKTTLPSAALFIIRYHSFYPLHQSGAYKYFMNNEDEENLKWLQIFNKYDLYSKSKVRVGVDKVKPYYLSLIEKYFPSKLRW